MSTLDRVMCQHAMKFGTTAPVRVIDPDGATIDGMIANVRRRLPASWLSATVVVTEEAPQAPDRPPVLVAELTKRDRYHIDKRRGTW